MKKNPLRFQKGFSLIDILLAIVILGIGLIGYLSFFSQLTRNTMIDESSLKASHLATEKIEQILASKAAGGYSNVPLGTTSENITYGATPFVRQTLTQWVSASDLKTVSGSDTGFKRIDVTVSWSNSMGQGVQMMGLVSNH